MSNAASVSLNTAAIIFSRVSYVRTFEGVCSESQCALLSAYSLLKCLCASMS